MRGACVGLLYMALGIVCYALMMGQSPQLAAYLADLGMGAGRGRFVRDDLDDEEKGISCNACYRNGGNCVQKDDMAEIREKMLAVDVIVWTSPIYFYTMTAQMEAGRYSQNGRARTGVSSGQEPVKAYEKPPSSPKWESVAV